MICFSICLAEVSEASLRNVLLVTCTFAENKLLAKFCHPVIRVRPRI